MIFQDDQEVIKFIQAHPKPVKWIKEARDYSKTLKALVYGDNYLEELIDKIEKIESSDRAEARRKYSKDIRDMFNRVLEPRSNVFSASGGSEQIEITSETIKEKFLMSLKEFKGNKSIKQYLADYLFQLMDVDPNGVMFMEYISDEKIYPAYKSIDDIRYYESDGQNIKYIIFEPIKKLVGQQTIYKWRVVDSEMEYWITQIGQRYVYDQEKSFQHPFGEVPGVVLSSMQKLGTEKRLSPLFGIEELAKDYARDKSILTLYKFLNGFPIHWRYTQQCRPCRGTGKTGQNSESCNHCDGKGYIGKNDVTDVLNVPMPKDNDSAKVAPDLAGFVSPDLNTWKQYMENQSQDEIKIEDTIWGTHRLRQGSNETATGRYIDVQPVINKLNDYADNAEWIHNELSKFVLVWCANNSETEYRYHRSYGRGFIIESPDVLLERYEKAREKQSNWTILDKLLKEYILSKYKSDPVMMNKMVKKAMVEPFVHLSIDVVNNIFGTEEAQRKEMFGDFWEQADKGRNVQELKSDFNNYVEEQQQLKGVDEVTKLRKTLNQLSPLVATKVLDELASNEVRSIVNKDGDKPIDQSE